MGSTWILGGYQSDVARSLAREGRDISDLTREVAEGTLEAAGVDARGTDATWAPG